MGSLMDPPVGYLPPETCLATDESGGGSPMPCKGNGRWPPRKGLVTVSAVMVANMHTVGQRATAPQAPSTALKAPRPSQDGVY